MGRRMPSAPSETASPAWRRRVRDSVADSRRALSWRIMANVTAGHWPWPVAWPLLRTGVVPGAPRRPWRPGHMARQCLVVAPPLSGGTDVATVVYGATAAAEAPTAVHTPMLIYQLADPARFRAVLKVGVVRDPWARLAAAHALLRSDRASPDDRRWARRWLPWREDMNAFVRRLDGDPAYCHQVMRHPAFLPQTAYLADRDGRGAADVILRAESLPEDVRRLSQRIALLHPVNALPELPPAEDAHALYTPETAAMVGRLYARDVAFYGYGGPAEAMGSPLAAPTPAPVG